MSKGKIYCAHCIPTGKKYIGQTRHKLLYNRIACHFADANKKTRKGKFQYALKKYGKDGFIWGIIEECDISLLNEKEIYWIKEYKTVTKGYNISPGGGQPPEYICKEYLVEIPTGERKQIKNLSKYCRDNNLNTGHLHETLSGKRVKHKGYKLIPRTEEEVGKYQKEREIREDTSRKGLPGEKNGRAILNWDKVKQIREMHSSKQYKNQEIAEIFEIKTVTVEKVVANKLWTV
jgi:group I intron endonuclease